MLFDTYDWVVGIIETKPFESDWGEKLGEKWSSAKERA